MSSKKIGYKNNKSSKMFLLGFVFLLASMGCKEDEMGLKSVENEEEQSVDNKAFASTRFNPKRYYNRLEFVKKDVANSGEFRLLTSVCADPSDTLGCTVYKENISFIYLGTYEQKLDANTGLKFLNVDVDKILVYPNTPEMASKMNSDKTCGVDQWKPGTRQLTSETCFQDRYHIMKSDPSGRVHLQLKTLLDIQLTETVRIVQIGKGLLNRLTLGPVACEQLGNGPTSFEACSGDPAAFDRDELADLLFYEIGRPSPTPPAGPQPPPTDGQPPISADY